jgi:hypothetical protein
MHFKRTSVFIEKKVTSHEKIRARIRLLASIFIFILFLLHVVRAGVSSLGGMRILVALNHVNVVKGSFALRIATDCSNRQLK